MKESHALRIQWSYVFLIATLIGLLNVGIKITDEMIGGEKIPLAKPLIYELTGAWTMALLIPFLLLFFHRFPLRKPYLWKRIPLYLGISILSGFCHTTLMTFSRKLVFFVVGYPSYHPGRILYRYLMEYHKQFMVFCLLYVVFLFLQKRHEEQKRDLRVAKLEEQLTKARLQTLQMQLHPHFLFNTLNMISSAVYEDAGKADRMIAELSDLLRLTLKGSTGERHEFAEELKLFHHYMRIMKERFYDRLAVEVRADTESRAAMVPAFILQPIIENAVKYGIEGNPFVKIRLTARRLGDRLEMAVEDNGSGMGEPDAASGKNGLGLSNTASRLENLYPGDHEFRMENLNPGFRVAIEIPFQKSEKERS